MTAPSIDAAPHAAPSERDRPILLSLIDRIDPSDAGAHSNLGVVLYRHGLVAEAIEQFRRALDLDQGLRTARRNLEIAYTESGRYDRQIAALRERLRSDADDHAARHELAQVYAALRRYDSAVDELQALVARAEPNVEVLIELGLAERALGRARAAAEWLERACALQPDHAGARRHLGTVLHELGRYEAALASLQRAVEADPDDPEAHYQLAFALGDLGRHDEANEATRHAIQLSPLIGRPSAHLSLEKTPKRPTFGTGYVDRRPSAALAHYNLGLGFRRRGLYVEALREFRLALEEGDDRNLVLPATASVHLLRRDHAAALELYEQLVDDLPSSAKMWNERGVVLHQLGRFDEALASYRRAADLEGTHRFAHNNSGVAYIHLGRNADAVESFHRAMQVDAAATLPRVNLGLLLLRLRQFEYAMDAFRGALGHAPGDPAAWNGVGLVLTELGRSDDARNAFARAVDADPDDAEAHYGLSFALSRLGEYDEALLEVTRAQTLNPYYQPGRFRLAIDLMKEDASLVILPEIAADVSAGLGREGFAFEAGLLDDLFSDLDGRGRPPAGPPDSPYRRARVLAAHGDLEGATDVAREGLATGHDPTEGNALLGELFARRGLFGESLERYRAARAAAPHRPDLRLGEIRQLLALGKSGAALGEAVTLAADHPGEIEALGTLAAARLAMDQPAKALEALGEARARAPQRADLLKLEGDIRLAQGSPREAGAAYRGAVQLEPSDVSAWIGLGRACERLEDARTAEAAYRRALSVDRQSVEALLALANLHRRGGDPARAVNLLAELLDRHPSNVEALAALGRALLDDGRPEHALHAFERLLTYDRTNVRAFFLSAVAEARRHRFREAVRCWERVIELDPNGPAAARARNFAATALDLEQIFPAEDPADDD